MSDPNPERMHHNPGVGYFILAFGNILNKFTFTRTPDERLGPPRADLGLSDPCPAIAKR